MIATRKRQPRLMTASHAPSTIPRVQLSNGSEFDVALSLVIGRKPKATPADARVTLVTVESPTSEVSGSHIEISFDDGQFRLRDLNSTNGSVIRSPHREAFLLAKGETAIADAETEIDIGDGNIISLVAP